jgi:hypothetical protein
VENYWSCATYRLLAGSLLTNLILENGQVVKKGQEEFPHVVSPGEVCR